MTLSTGGGPSGLFCAYEIITWKPGAEDYLLHKGVEILFDTEVTDLLVTEGTVKVD